MATPSRSRSAMSDKQIGRAAHDGRMLKFRTAVMGSTTDVSGYVVGADDYHWLVAAPAIPGSGPRLVLVHKSCPLVEFTEQFLKSEGEIFERFAAEVGQPFWNHCKKTYLGRTSATEQEQK